MTKDKLKLVTAEIDGWLNEMPSRATAFHERGRLLKRDIDEANGRWFPGRRLDEIDDQYQDMQTVFPDLKKVMLDVGDLETRFSKLPDLAGKLGDPDLKVKVLQECERWRDRLRPLARATTMLSLAELRKEDPRDQEDRLTKIAIEVAPYEAALTKLPELRARVQKLTTVRNPESAALATELKRLLEALKISAPSPDRLREIDICLKRAEDVEVLAPLPPPAPPPSFREIRKQLGQARYWANALNSSLSQIEEFNDRVRQAEQSRVALTPDAVDALLRDVSDELNRLRKQAQSKCMERRDDFEEKVRYYNHVIPAPFKGALPGLDNMDEPENYKAWNKSFEDTKKSFEALAQTKTDLLHNHLKDRVSRLKTQLDALVVGRLPSSMKPEADLLAQCLERRVMAEGRDPVLDALRETTDDEATLNELRKRAVQGRQQLDGVLNERKALAEACTTLSITIELPEEAEMLEQGLDWAQARMKEARDRFIEQTTAKREELRLKCEALAGAMKLADGRPVPGVVSTIAPIASVDETVLRWKELEALRETLAKAAEGWLKLEPMQFAAEMEPKILPHVGLGDEDGEAKGILEDIRCKDWDLETSVERQIRRFCDVRAKCAQFFDSLEGEEKKAQESIAELKQLYRQIRDNDFRRYFNLHAARASHLIRGVPEQLENWRTVQPQIDEAKNLLKLMLRHGRRLAARETDEVMEQLRLRVDHMRPSPLKDEIVRHRAVVLECAERHELAPASTRSALRQLASRSTHA